MVARSAVRVGKWPFPAPRATMCGQHRGNNLEVSDKLFRIRDGRV